MYRSHRAPGLVPDPGCHDSSVVVSGPPSSMDHRTRSRRLWGGGGSDGPGGGGLRPPPQPDVPQAPAPASPSRLVEAQAAYQDAGGALYSRWLTGFLDVHCQYYHVHLLKGLFTLLVRFWCKIVKREFWWYLVTCIFCFENGAPGTYKGVREKELSLDWW